MFTLPETDTDTDKKWVLKNCVEVFILPDTDTGKPILSVGVGVGIGVSVGIGVGQCEHTINLGFS